MDVRIPARLRTGDLVGVISPASPLEDVSRLERGIRYLESRGYRAITVSASARPVVAVSHRKP